MIVLSFSPHCTLGGRSLGSDTVHPDFTTRPELSGTLCFSVCFLNQVKLGSLDLDVGVCVCVCVREREREEREGERECVWGVSGCMGG